MLREVFRTEPLKYFKSTDPEGKFFPPPKPNVNVAPYIESITSTPGRSWGLIVTRDPSLLGPTSIYLFTWLHSTHLYSMSVGNWRFDGRTGKLLAREPLRPTVTAPGNAVGLINGMNQARSGALWVTSFYTDYIGKFRLEPAATINGDRQTAPNTRWTTYNDAWVHISHWTYEDGSHPIAYYEWALDDKLDVFIMILNGELQCFTNSTGKIKYRATLPANAARIALEDDSRMYVLMANGVLMLYDYIRGEVLGSTRMPPILNDRSYWNTNIQLAWDATFKRLLVFDIVPNKADGLCASVVQGFRPVPEATRITMPIPLKVPRQRRTVPVLAQVVGDMNEGVGGYVIGATVTGSGSLVGVPITDYYGTSYINVALEGSPFFYASPPLDWASTGSPEAPEPHAGLVRVLVEARMWQPQQGDIPVTGVSGPPPGYVDPTKPGPGTGGTDPESGLPSEAPNMMYILEQVKASDTWDFRAGHEEDPKGNGAFTEAAAIACHDVDARWGHRNKTGGASFNGHAVDAIVWKNPDGVTGEVFDIVSGASEDIQWMFQGRSATGLSFWRYP